MQSNTNHDAFIAKVFMDAKILRKFAFFDTFRRQKRWTPVATFAALMTAFAVLCFALRSVNEQAVLIGTVLLFVGLGLPIVYVGSFFHSLQAKAKRLRLNQPRHAYTLTFQQSGDGMHVEDSKESFLYVWESLYHVFRTQDSFYLYVLVNKAFVLPIGQLSGDAEALWALLAEKLPAEKITDAR